jgi:hypothetical protein
MTRLSPHFTLDELTHSEYAVRMGLDNTPTSNIIRNLTSLADRLETVRNILGDKPIVVTSAYRSPQVNAGVGGSAQSAHMLGNAADILCPTFGRPKDVVAVLRAHFNRLAYDQIILEYPDSVSGGWTHVGFATRPRGQVLVKRPGKGYEVLPL